MNPEFKREFEALKREVEELRRKLEDRGRVGTASDRKPLFIKAIVTEAGGIASQSTGSIKQLYGTTNGSESAVGAEKEAYNGGAAVTSGTRGTAVLWTDSNEWQFFPQHCS